MELKTKKRIWPYLLALAALLLGLGMQLMLAAFTGMRASAQAGSEARLLTARAAQALRLAAQEQAAADAARTEAGERSLAEKGRAAEDESILILVNAWNPVPEDYRVQLTEVSAGQSMDSRCAGALLEMLEACKASGAHPEAISTYRTQEFQQQLYDDKIRRVLLEGTPEEEAPRVAAQSVAVPGTSEHQLGLAADIIDESYPYLNTRQETTASQIWLMEHCWEYGFILRYPNGTTDITGIIYEPWHYRYVGRAAAEEIRDLGVTLEEYLQLRRPGNS